MIYLFTALYGEAHIFIRRYHLIKNPENTCFQEFYNEKSDIRLTITGVGEVNAAAAVSSICSLQRPGPGDILLNVGICASIKVCDGIFLCNKLVEQATGKTFYPDMLYRHEFEEAALVTGMLPWSGGRAGMTGTLSWNSEHDGDGLSDSGGTLYDMEAAAIYQAGSYFFGPHQMMFLKIVSDKGMAGAVTPKQVELLMEQNQDRILAYISRLQMTAHGEGQRGKRLPHEEEALIERLSNDLHCSKAMRDSLRQHIHYLTLAGADYDAVIQAMYRQKLLPCRDKREGKRCFEELKRKLF